ncbi:MAG: hypothetical protein Q8Q00_06910 [Dehalococcoidia bacterium]|nr:hypothetical protein [Dehalococcoidia bacterium]
MSKRPHDPPLLVEVIPSRWDDEPIPRAQSALSGLAGVDSLSLEFAATDEGLRFYVRAGSATVMEHVQAQLGAAYPQAGLREIPTADRPDLDPAWRAEGEETAAIELRLRHGPNLPVASDWHRRVDPLKGVLAAASVVLEGERVICQLVLAPAPSGWADGLRSRLVVPQAGVPHRTEAGPTQDILPFVALFGIGAAGLQGYRWYQAGDFLPLVGMSAAGLVGLPLAAALAARFTAGRQPMARELVDDKLAHPAFAVQLRVLAFGPPSTPGERLRVLVARAAEAYQAFDHPAGNGLRAHPWRGDPRQPVFDGGLLRNPDILNAAELAGLWHLPCDAAGPSAGERMASRRLLPAAHNLGRGCRVGVSAHQGPAVPVQMPLSLLFRNQLVVAKTRRGKSTLLLHLASYLMQRMAAGRERASLVVVDPHQDLAEPVLGAVPPALEERVVYLNLADRQRPVGLNLLDVALFPERDRTTENVITMMHRLWPNNWGPRMEGALRAAVSCLHEANAVRPREEQYTLLDVVAVLTSVDFREEVLKQVPDRALWVWWRDNYDRISRTFQQQTANPITTKVGRFIVTEAARLVLGQARSTIDPRALLREGGVLVVNSAVGALGEGGAALMGATLLNLMGLVVEEQVALPPAERCRLVALVDESSTLGAADYGHMLSELSKYGASFVLVTQSLAKLDAIDRVLRPTVFSNIDGLTVFQVSAEDARYLAPELGGDLEVADLIDQDDFECYARWWADGRRLPAFSVRLDPPPPIDRERVAAISRRSAERFGRPREEVLAEIDKALAERGGLGGPLTTPQTGKADDGDNEEAKGEPQPTARANPPVPDRSRHRGRGRGA